VPGPWWGTEGRDRGRPPRRATRVRLRSAARNDGTFGDGRHRKHHPDPCEAWGRKARLGDETWEAPVLAQVGSIALDEDTMASVVAALGSSRQPVAIDRARIDRQMRELALEHAAGSLGDDAYLARLKVHAAAAGRGHRADGCRATGRACARVAARPRRVAPAPEKSKEKADLMHAIYDRITVTGPEIVGVRLTQAAYAHGLALALPKRLNWRARQVLGAR